MNLGKIVGAAEYNVLGYRTAELPPGITHVDVTVQHPVPSISIILFRFVLSYEASSELTRLFQREDPALREDTDAWMRREGRPLVSQMRASTRAVRERQRAACVRWVRSQVPGLFARWDGAVTAELITLEKAEPLRGSGSYDEPYLRALGLGRSFSASELWGRQGLRLDSPFSYRSEGHLVFCGRNDELYELVLHPDERGSIVECVEKHVDGPMVQWALHETVRRAAERITALRDAVAEIAADETTKGSTRLGEVQREFMRLTVDTVPMEREIRELCADDTLYHREGASEYQEIEACAWTSTASEHVFETVRKRTLDLANGLGRVSTDLREMMSTTSSIVNSLAQQRSTEENLALQRRVHWLTIVFGVLAAILSLFQMLG